MNHTKEENKDITIKLIKNIRELERLLKAFTIETEDSKKYAYMYIIKKKATMILVPVKYTLNKKIN